MVDFIESILYFQPTEGKEEEVIALVKQATETIKSEEGCLFYGAFRGESNGLVRVRGGFADAQSFGAHIQREQETMMKLMALGNITKMQVNGPAEAEPVLGPLVEARGGQYFTHLNGFNRLPNKATANAVEAVPYFTVHEGKLPELQAIWTKLVGNTKENENGCLYYGFSQRGNVGRCIEAYEDGAAFLVHVGNVGEHLQAASSLASLDLEIHGPAEEIEKMKDELAPLGGRFYIQFTGYGKE